MSSEPPSKEELASLRERFDALNSEVESFLKTKKSASDFDHDTQIAKRRFWRRLDKLRSGIFESSKISTSDKLVISADEVKALEKKLSLNSKGKFSFYAIVRAFAVLAWMLLTFPWMMLVAPIRLVYPIFRRCGIHSNYLPLDYILIYWSKMNCILAGLEVRTEGVENANSLLGAPSGALVLFQHSSNLDGFLIQAGCKLALKWVGKKSLARVPIVGWLGAAYGAILFIDRENHEKAIGTLNYARSVMHRYRRSVGIAPEGTRSVTGHLMPFKKGPFHLALDVKAPLLPVVTYGASELWPKNQLFTDSGAVVVSYLKPIQVKEIEGKDYNQVLDLVREKMLDKMDSYPTKNAPSRTVTPAFKALHFFAVAAVFTLFYIQTKWFLNWLW